MQRFIIWFVSQDGFTKSVTIVAYNEDDAKQKVIERYDFLRFLTHQSIKEVQPC